MWKYIEYNTLNLVGRVFGLYLYMTDQYGLKQQITHTKKIKMKSGGCYFKQHNIIYLTIYNMID